jgi:hypothetical protein
VLAYSTPFNVAAGNSSGYNYASGRLDHQTYFKSIRVDQDHFSLVVLDRILRSWLDEAILISEFLPIWMRTVAFRDFLHQWFWDGQEHVEPAKERQISKHCPQQNNQPKGDPAIIFAKLSY